MEKWRGGEVEKKFLVPGSWFLVPRFVMRSAGRGRVRGARREGSGEKTFLVRCSRFPVGYGGALGGDLKEVEK